MQFFTGIPMKSSLVTLCVAASLLVWTGCMAPGSGTGSTMAGADFGMASLVGSESAGNDIAATIQVIAPSANTMLTSGADIHGKVKGWAQGGGFPVEVMDDAGKVLFAGDARTAGGSAEEFVAFTVKATFETPAARRGKVVLHRPGTAGGASQTMEIPVMFRK